MSFHISPELWSFDPDSKEAVADYRKHLERLRHAALDRPLHPSEELVLQGPRIGHTSINLTEQHGRERRPLPWLLHDMSGRLNTVLRECLRGGENVWSQVWQCDVSAAENQTQTAPSTVIVKLFEESLGALPWWNESRRRLEDDYIPMKVMREHERWAYEAMKPLQGGTILYSYGFYNV